MKKHKQSVLLAAGERKPGEDGKKRKEQEEKKQEEQRRGVCTTMHELLLRRRQPANDFGRRGACERDFEILVVGVAREGGANLGKETREEI